jgi:orotidine-5'-phosphate decarboxylase
MSFNEKLDQVIGSKKSMLCVGLDTVLDKIPEAFRHESEPLFSFNKAIIDATLPFAAAFKINTAFYEAYGSTGWQALEKTFAYLPEDVIKIADAKRGDIGNTSQMYSRALFEGLGADAVTVSPLLGSDSTWPFLKNPDKGVFFLCLTSNPGSRDFQHFSDGAQKLYQRIAEKVNEWNVNGNCGLVVGATHPLELQEIRHLATALPFLIPGIGAQGGDLDNSVRYGVTAKGKGAIFNSSRAIIFASSGPDFAAAAARVAQETRDALNTAAGLNH